MTESDRRFRLSYSCSLCIVFLLVLQSENLWWQLYIKPITFINFYKFRSPLPWQSITFFLFNGSWGLPVSVHPSTILVTILNTSLASFWTGDIYLVTSNLGPTFTHSNRFCWFIGDDAIASYVTLGGQMTSLNIFRSCMN